MTAMIEEIQSNDDHSGDNHDDDSSIPEMFRSTSGLLDSLDKLTKEIRANLMSAEDPGSITGSNESSSNDDEDFYWEDDENYYPEDDDPDSGEKKLFSMMDQLVVELMMELKDENVDEYGKDSQKVVDEENDETIINKGDRSSTAEIIVNTRNDDKKNIAGSDESDLPSIVPTLSDDCGSSTSNLNLTHPIGDDRAEKQKKLHEHVKKLLRQVTELTNSMSTKKRKSVKNEYNDKISANIQRKIEQGDNDADRVEHLMGAVATYSKFKEANTNAIASFTSPSKSLSAVKTKKKKRTNKHKRRKSKSFVQTQQSLQILFDSLEALDKKLSREKL